jgi:hypothetical protein
MRDARQLSATGRLVLDHLLSAERSEPSAERKQEALEHARY